MPVLLLRRPAGVCNAPIYPTIIAKLHSLLMQMPFDGRMACFELLGEAARCLRWIGGDERM